MLNEEEATLSARISVLTADMNGQANALSRDLRGLRDALGGAPLFADELIADLIAARDAAESVQGAIGSYLQCVSTTEQRMRIANGKDGGQ